MAQIEITTPGGGSLSNGVLQLENGVALDTTLRYVTDQTNTKSQLLLATNATTVEGTLKVKTNNVEYLDVEDGSGNNRFTISRPALGQKVALDFASNPVGSTTIVGSIRTYTDGTNLNDIVQFREDGQTTFVERVNVEADSLVTTQSSSVIAASTTNANLVIAPNGTGALVADIPDGTVTGGNARGTNAVDLQMNRANASQVASGLESIILGGNNNRSSGERSISAGGQNVSSAYTSIAIGENCVASNSYSIAIGNANTASSANSTVSGGQSNTASTGTHATVVGGLSNTSSGNHSVSGGNGNTGSGRSSVALGRGNIASAAESYAIGDGNNVSGSTSSSAIGGGNSISTPICYALGWINNISGSGNLNVAIGNNNSIQGTGNKALATSAEWLAGDYTTTIGISGSPYLRNQFVHGAVGNSPVRGRSQLSQLIAYNDGVLTTGATVTLSLDGTGTTNLIIPNSNNRMWNVQVRWVAVVTAITGTAAGVTVGDTKTSTDLLAVARRSGSTTVSAHTSAGTHAIETIAGSLAAANIAYSAGASQEMAITFTGPTFGGGGSVTMRVVAAISLTEVAY